MTISASQLIVLGIETSCDETGIAILAVSAADSAGELPRATLLGQALHSQVSLHQLYGGVVPELASRDHLLRIVPLLQACLVEAQIPLARIDLIGVTQGPGLAGALLVGNSVAHGIGAGLQKPIVGIHHLEAHLLSALIDPAARALTFPFLALLVSGGHTQIMRVNGIGAYELLGDTIDDAAGEAFDKTAQLLGLGYPGGPAIAACAENGTAARFKLPRPLKHRPGFDFSFAGLKTAVLTQVQRHQPLTPKDRSDLAAGLQAAIVDVLVSKSMAALDATGIDTLVVAGGVSANQMLRSTLASASERRQVRVLFPPPALCTDNGVMIAWAAGLRHLAGEPAKPAGVILAQPRWDLSSVGLSV